MLAKVQGRRKTFITQSKGDFPVDPGPRHKILYNDLIHLQGGTSADDCCHDCYKLGKNEILERGINVECEKGYWPNKNQVQALNNFSF